MGFSFNQGDSCRPSSLRSLLLGTKWHNHYICIWLSVLVAPWEAEKTSCASVEHSVKDQRRERLDLEDCSLWFIYLFIFIFSSPQKKRNPAYLANITVCVLLKSPDLAVVFKNKDLESWTVLALRFMSALIILVFICPSVLLLRIMIYLNDFCQSLSTFPGIHFVLEEIKKRQHCCFLQQLWIFWKTKPHPRYGLI